MRRWLFQTVSLLFLCIAAQAQSVDAYNDNLPYEPTDTWPYLYAHFENGAVRTTKGALLSYTTLNICIGDGKLHYVQGDKIMQADMSNVFTARVGEEDVFVNIGGKMYKVLFESEEGFIVSLTSVDYDELKKVDIGYGVSSSTASMTNTNLAGLGIDSISGVNMMNMTLNRAEQQKNSGKVLPTKVDNYFYVGGKFILADKREVQDLVGKESMKAFLKENKVKWSKPETLVPVVAFLSEQLNKQ